MKKIPKVKYEEAKISKEEKEERISAAFGILFDEVLRIEREKAKKKKK